MTPTLFISIAVDPALSLLPRVMDTPEARAMVVAICLQESRIAHRRQIGGPARGYAQFERNGGCAEVLSHRASAAHATRICDRLDIVPSTSAVYAALEYHDVLAVVFARLLLWTLPEALPVRGAHEESWRQYIKAWKPGRPHRATWNDLFDQAWQVVDATRKGTHP